MATSMKEKTRRILDGIDNFTRGYIIASLWSSTDESTPQGGDPIDGNHDMYDLSPVTAQQMKDDCQKFQADCADGLVKYYIERTIDPSQGTVEDYAGHDFWLTRNHHGAGFWDRGLGELGDLLTKEAHKWKEIHLYVSRGKIYS